jgi:formylglycine-generating enzyme required for sulfatase activity
MQITRDYHDGMIQGMGYNALTGEIYDTFVEYARLSTMGDTDGQTAELLYKHVQSSSELHKLLGTNFEANVNATWFQLGGSLKAKAVEEVEQKANQFSSFSVLYVKVSGAPKILVGVKLRTDEVKVENDVVKYIERVGLDAFHKIAGYEYISGFIAGGEFISTIEIISSDRETKQKIDAELSAEISYKTIVSGVGSIEAKAELKSRFESFAKYSNVRIEARCYRKGGAGLLVVNPQEALKYALDFPASVRESKQSILQVFCRPYEEILNFPPKKMEGIDNVMFLQKQQRILKGLWDQFQKISRTIEQIDDILLNPMQFERVDLNTLRKGKIQLEEQLDQIIEKATSCAREPNKHKIDPSEFSHTAPALPTRYRLEDLIEFVNIPAGSFMMGGDVYSNGLPIHLVNVKAFRMGKYPITQKQYLEVMGDNPSDFKGDENCPIEQVSWHQAVEFCQKLSQRTGQTVRLPSEAEWEYACRAGSTGKYCFGDDKSKLGSYAWFGALFVENSDRKTHPVGKKSSNAWGLHDMHGNVWEWCEDIWHENYQGAPSDGSAWINGGDRDIKVRRGGSWISFDNDCRSANRGMVVADYRSDINGFRVVV